MVCFICSELSIKVISLRIKCGLFGSVFQKIIPNNTTPALKEVGGVSYPSHFVDDIGTSHGIALTITKLIDFYSQGIIMFLYATVFN